MRTVRWSSVGLGLVALLVAAVLGGVLERLHGVTAGSTLRSPWVEAFLGRAVGPFAGGFRDPVRTPAVLGWVLGLVVALLVLGAVLAAASRAGSGFATVSGAWLGSILGCGVGGMASALVVFSALLGAGSPYGAQLPQLTYAALAHGLYWGAVVGWLVGAVALLGGVGRPRTL